jgi:hypothetical protein
MVEDSTHEIVQDDCGKNMSQYFNGSMNKEVYVTGCIYEIIDFNINTHIYYNESPKEGQQVPDIPSTLIETNIKPPTCKRYFEASTSLVSDMERLNYEEFMQNYKHKYRYYYRKDDGTWENGYQIVGDDYFALYYHTKRLKDGEKRRKKLYENMCLRRVMFPEITPNEVLYCAYVDFQRFIDNSQDPIYIECLVRNVKSAFKLSVEEIEQKYREDIAYLRSKKPKHGIIYDVRGAKNQSERNTKEKEIRWTRYDRLYETSLSPKENAVLFGIDVKTMRRYCKDRGIPTSNKVSDEFIRQMINLSLSIRGNVKYFKESEGIGISKDRISIIKKELEYDLQRINKIVKDERGLFIFAMNEDRSILKDYYPICKNIDVDSGRRLVDNNVFCEQLMGLLIA